MVCPPAFGTHFFRSPRDIRGSEQILKALISNGTITHFWRGSADPADTAGIVLAYVDSELLFQANLKPPGTAFLLCGVVGIGEAFFHIQPKICQQHISRMTVEPH